MAGTVPKTAKRTAAKEVTAVVEEAKAETGLSRVDKLRSKLSLYYGKDDTEGRYANQAIKFNAMDVKQWPASLAYYWMPAPGGDAPPAHNSPQAHAMRQSFITKGWQFYPSEDFGRGEDDMPYVLGWQEQEGMVRHLDHWLMYADAEIEERRRQENRDAWNNQLTGKKEAGDVDGAGIIRTHESGTTTVDKLLKDSV